MSSFLSLDGFGDSSFSFTVTDSDPTLGSTDDSVQVLDADQITDLEFDLKVDLDGDSIAGVNVENKLIDRQYDASGNYINNTSDLRYLYSTTGGLLLSLNSLNTDSDLRNASVNSSSSSDGPSLLLLQDGSGGSFSIPSGETSLALQVCRDSSNNADGYKLFTRDGNGAITEYNFDLDGSQTADTLLSEQDLSSLEVQLKTDLNNDSVVGATVIGIQFDKQYDASGNYISNNNDLRYLYNTSGGGLLLSRNQHSEN